MQPMEMPEPKGQPSGQREQAVPDRSIEQIVSVLEAATVPNSRELSLVCGGMPPSRDQLGALAEMLAWARSMEIARASRLSVQACYSVVNQLDRPVFRCDSAGLRPSMAISLVPFLVADQGNALANAGVAMDRFVAAVGRIEPPDGSRNRFIGTCFLITAEGFHGIALTNWHVIVEMLRFTSGDSLRKQVVRFETPFVVDFDGSERPSRRLAKVLSASRHPGVDGFGEVQPDIGVLELDLSDVPEAAGGISDIDLASECPRDTSVIVVGFPLSSPLYGIHDGVDWDELLERIFGDRRGFKCVAPGRITASVDTLPTSIDPLAMVVAHDASTLGGSSGSPVFSAETGHSIAIHFAGEALVANYANSLRRSWAVVERMLAR